MAFTKHSLHIVCPHDSDIGTSSTAKQIGQITDVMVIGGGGGRKKSVSRYSTSCGFRDGIVLLNAVIKLISPATFVP